MDPPHHIQYVDDKSILLINKTGKLRQLYVPFRVLCIEQVANIKTAAWVYVDEVAQHHQFRIMYLICGEWIPYSCFRIIVNF